MSKSIQDIEKVCANIVSEKQTERKQSTTRLDLLLRDKDVIKLLDEKSARKSRDDVTWDFLVQRVARYNLIELKNTKTNVQPDTIRRKHKEAADLYQTVIRIAEERGPTLKSLHVFKHISCMIQRVEQTSPFVDVYTSVVLKYMLCKRKHVADLTVALYEEILLSYCKLIYGNASKCPVQLALVVKNLLMSAYLMPSIPNDMLLLFFDKLLHSSRLERNIGFLEIILCSFNLFCQVRILDVKSKICETCQNLLPTFVEMWKFQATNIKTELLKLFNLLLKTQKYNHEKDNVIWQKCLQDLFGLIYQEFYQQGGRISMQNNKSTGQDKKMIQFAAAVFSQSIRNRLPKPTERHTEVDPVIPQHQDLHFCLQKCEATAVFATERLLHDAHRKHAKRKLPHQTAKILALLLTGLWETPKDDPVAAIGDRICKNVKIIKEGNQNITLSYSMVCTGTSSKRSKISFDTPWQALTHGINNANTQSVIAWIQVLTELYDSHAEFILKENRCTEFISLLHHIASATKKRDLQAYIFSCLLSIVRKSFGLEDVQAISFIALKALIANPPSLEAANLIRFLWKKEMMEYTPDIFKLFANNSTPKEESMLLLNMVLISGYLPEKLCLGGLAFDANDTVFPLRAQLLHWLLPVTEDCDMFVVVENLPSNDLGKLATSMLSLALTSPIALKDNASEATSCSLEKELTTTAFVSPNTKFKIDTNPTQDNQRQKKYTTIDCIWKIILEKMFIILNALNTDDHSDLQRSLKLCMYALSILIHLSVGLQRIKETKFDDKISQLTEKVARKFVTLVEKSSKTKCAHKMLNATILHLKKTVFSCYTSEGTLLINAVPMTLTSLLMRIIENRLFNEVDEIPSDFLNSLRSRSSSFDDMEIDSQDGVTDNAQKDKNKRDGENPTKRAYLLDSEKLQLAAWECLLVSYHQQQDALLKSITQSETSEVKLQMLFALNKYCEEQSIHLEPNVVLSLVTLSRQYLSTYRFDQDVCCLVLAGVSYYAQQLANLTHDHAHNEARLIIVQVIAVFWSVKDDKCSPRLLQKLATVLGVITSLELTDSDIWKIELKDEADNVMLTPPSRLLTQLMFAHSMHVQLHTIPYLSALFVRKNFRDCKKNYKYLLECQRKFSSQSLEDINDVCKADIVKNRETNLLIIALELMACAPCLEMKIFTYLLSNVISSSLDATSVHRMLLFVCKRLGYKDLNVYLSPRLGRLISSHLENQENISTFPAQCFGISNKEFVRQNYKLIVAYMVLRKDFDGVEALHNMLPSKNGQNWKQLLVDSFVCIMALAYPPYVSRIVNQTEVTSTDSLDALEQVKNCLTVDLFSKEIERHFSDIIVQMIIRLYDEPLSDLPMSKYANFKDGIIYNPNFSSKSITDAFLFMSRWYGTDKEAVAVFLKQPSCMLKILVSIATLTMQAKEQTLRLHYLRAYVYFADFLIQQFHMIDFAQYCGASIVREIVFRMLYVVEEQSEGMCCEMGFDLLEKVFNGINNQFVLVELSKQLVIIISKLQAFVLKVSSERAAQLLSYLLVECTSNDDNLALINACCALEVLPHPQFTDANTRLAAIKRSMSNPGVEHELERVIKILVKRDHLNSEQTLENLVVFLKENLDVVLRCDCLTDLVNSLKEICVGGKTPSKLLAVDCLGLIGPLQIKPSVRTKELECEHSAAMEKTLTNPLTYQLHHILASVSKLCVHPSVEISSAAYDCLEGFPQFDVSREFLKECRACSFVPYIAPYFCKRKKSDNKEHEERGGTGADVLLSSLARLSINGGESHDTWLKQLLSILLNKSALKNQVFYQVSQLCQLETSFAKSCLPFVIHNILCAGEQYKDALSHMFNTWISTFVSMDDSYSHFQESRLKVLNLVSVVTYLRQQDITSSNKHVTWHNNFWLDVHYLNLAQAALRCFDYFTAALFMEIWCDDLRKQDPNAGSESTLESSSGEVACSQEFRIEGLSGSSPDVASNVACQQLLYDIYKNLGDVDLVYGVGAGSLSNPATRIKTYQHEYMFNKALLTSDLHSSAYSNDSQVLENLMKSGLYHTALTYMNADPESNKNKETQYEIAWRCGIWDMDRLRCVVSDKLGFHGNLRQSLCAIKSNDAETFHSHLRNAKLEIVGGINPGQQVTKATYQFLSKCHVISTLQNTAQKIASNSSGLSLSNDFDYYEPALSMQIAALKLACQRSDQSELNAKDALCRINKQLKNLCKISREAKRFEITEKCIHDFREVERIGKLDIDWKLEEAKLYWARGEPSHAIHILKTLKRQAEKGECDSAIQLYPVVLGLYGHWLGETRSENPVHIMENFLEPAIDIMEGEDYSGTYTPIDAYHSLAKFADQQYRMLVDYIKSPAFENKQNVVKQHKEEIRTIPNGTAEPQVKRHRINLEKQVVIDEAELNQSLEDKKKFLEKAVNNYSKCLRCGDKYDLKILRICSLWFENYTNLKLNENLKEMASGIQSRKFLLVMYQLAARLGTQMTQQCSPFNQNLQNIIEECISDHPHHTIFILLALCNADIEEKMAAKTRSKTSRMSKRHSPQCPQDAIRVGAAQNVLNRVKSSKPEMTQDAERLAMAYNELAYWDIKHLAREKGPFQIPDSKMLRKIANLTTVASPTVELAVDATCKYENIVHIVKFNNHFTHAGGVNLPKIISCIGSDGKSRRQLIKGRDDLRQDAVMQQVFGVVNLLLKNDAETRKRDLSVKTYKVVPLSRRSGLMEWCEGTMPLGDYLLGGRDGKVGAHQRYYPRDWSPKDCRKKIKEAIVHEGRNSKFSVYNTITRHFHPVFRHFFIERFKEPSLWFNRRLSYTRSVAASSIVGYIVGLGDRHFQNILIDCNTAEVVHIDLGIAFEQGKLLPTPEMVPFRLTPDVVDGMGVIGIEGVFRRCCEKTMHVMRESQEAILTIIEVLLYDPLSSWTVISSKALRQQTRPDDESLLLDDKSILDSASQADAADRNKMAERVLLRLKQKLSGLEGGCFLGVQGQVNYLIQEARSVDRLCKMFEGWQPWM